jgi:hypothetical protein
MVFKAKPAKNVVKIIALKGLKDMVQQAHPVHWTVESWENGGA